MSRQTSERIDETPLGTEGEAPVACSLSEERQAERRKELRAGLMRRIRRVRELSDGYAFGLDCTARDEREAREFVEFEGQCCGFANFQIERDEERSVIWLTVRGPSGTKALLIELVPASLAIEASAAGEPRRPRALLRAGVAGAITAVVGIVCCATPILAVALGAVGLGTAVGIASLWIDVIAGPILLVSALAIGIALRRRARPIA